MRHPAEIQHTIREIKINPSISKQGELKISMGWLQHHMADLSLVQNEYLQVALDALQGKEPVRTINVDQSGGQFELTQIKKGVFRILYERDKAYPTQISYIHIQSKDGAMLVNIGKTCLEQASSSGHTCGHHGLMALQGPDARQRNLLRAQTSLGITIESDAIGAGSLNISKEQKVNLMQVKRDIKILMEQHHFTHNQIHQIVMQQNAEQILESIVKYSEKLKELNYNFDQITEMAVIGQENLLLAVIQHTDKFSQSLNRHLIQNHLFKIASRFTWEEVLKRVEHYQARNKIFDLTQEQIYKLASHFDGVYRLNMMEKLAQNFISLGLTSEQVFKIADNVGGANRLKQVIDCAQRLKDIGFTGDHLVKIAAHYEGIETLQLLLDYTEKLKKALNFTIDQIVDIVAQYKGTEVLQVLVHYLEQFKSYRFTEGQLIAIAKRDKGAGALKFLIDYAEKLTKEFCFTDERVSRAIQALLRHADSLVNYYGFKQNWIFEIISKEDGIQTLEAIRRYVFPLREQGLSTHEIYRQALIGGKEALKTMLPIEYNRKT